MKSTLPTSVDVLVVGAGPAGLTASTVLHSRGVHHLTVDRAPLGTNTSRAAVVHARTLEVLDDIGIADTLVERGVVVPTFTVRDHDRVLVTIGFDDLPTRFPYTLMVPQNITEAVLADHLRTQGGSITPGWRLDRIDLDTDPGRVHADLVDEDGRRSTIAARYLIAADGMHSTARELVGIPFQGAAYPQSFVLADVRMDWSLPADEVQLFFSPAGLVVVAPLPGGHHRVVATVDDAPEHPDLADITDLLSTRGPRSNPTHVHEVAWSSRFRVHHRLAATYRHGPVLLAGDAAHVHSPAGGQGMNIGIQDAALLANLIADVTTGDAPDQSLDAYEERRRPIARGVVRLTDRMTRAATLHGPATRVRNLALRTAGALPPVRHALAMNLSELNTGERQTHAPATRRSPRRATSEPGQHR
ncbi:FAD-dependent oxidoreductase [Pseudonocardia sp. GCM10023141]|uniref:FAD-dependent oxidoreductase n=1 Tax=Pseudonocardia sp. GCM10023141 TaxID=3252653 RepID=UPI00360846F9